MTPEKQLELVVASVEAALTHMLKLQQSVFRTGGQDNAFHRIAARDELIGGLHAAGIESAVVQKLTGGN